MLLKVVKFVEFRCLVLVIKVVVVVFDMVCWCILCEVLVRVVEFRVVRVVVIIRVFMMWVYCEEGLECIVCSLVWLWCEDFMCLRGFFVNG